MIDLNAAAASLYGPASTPAAPPASTDTSAEPVQAPAIAPAVVEQPAVSKPHPADEFTKIPEAIREQRAQDDARKLYTAQVELAAIPGGNTPAAVEAREIVRDMGISAADLPVVIKAINKPAQNDAERTAMQAKAMQLLAREFGADDAQQALDDAKAYLKADPRRAALLARAGDDAATVLLIAQRARAAKAAGRI